MQFDCFKDNAIEPLYLTGLLRDSVTRSFNTALFDALLDCGVSVSDIFERQKSLLHLCAKISDYSLASQKFTPRLRELDALLDAQNEDRITLWTDAMLNRKWDLTDLLLKRGANIFIIVKKDLTFSISISMPSTSAPSILF